MLGAVLDSQGFETVECWQMIDVVAGQVHGAAAYSHVIDADADS